MTIVNGSRGCSDPIELPPVEITHAKVEYIDGLARINVTVAALGAAVPRFTVHAFPGTRSVVSEEGQNAKLAQEGSLPLNDGRAEIVLHDGVR